MFLDMANLVEEQVGNSTTCIQWNSSLRTPALSLEIRTNEDTFSFSNYLSKCMQYPFLISWTPFSTCMQDTFLCLTFLMGRTPFSVSPVSRLEVVRCSVTPLSHKHTHDPFLFISFPSHLPSDFLSLTLLPLCLSPRPAPPSCN